MTRVTSRAFRPVRYRAYVIRRERAHDWRVWSRSTLTGDLKDCVSLHTTKRGAVAACRRLNQGAAT